MLIGDKAIKPVFERITEDKLRRGKLLGRLTQREVLEWLDQRTNPYRELMTYYRCAMMEVETKFNVLNEELSLQYDRNPIESVRSRLKEPESILEKLQRKNLPLTIEAIENNIFDVAGVRVICSFPEDIYMLTDCLLRQDDIVLVEKKDYIKNPKPSGYRSLHLIVEVPIFLHDQKRMMKVEVQLRTIAMDFWASLEHKIRYKKDLPEMEAISEELRRCSEMSAQLDARMEAVRRWIENQTAEGKNEKKEDNGSAHTGTGT